MDEIQKVKPGQNLRIIQLVPDIEAVQLKRVFCTRFSAHRLFRLVLD
jgi:hypothetical protein